jgi:hypothetical protein
MDGAGLLVQGGAPSISNCIFTENMSLNGPDGSCPAGALSPGRGAAIAFDNATARIINCRFLNNRTGNGGRGNYCQSLTDGRGGPGGDGGAIFVNRGTLWMLNCSFDRNRAGNGGPGDFGLITGFPGGRGGDGGALHLNQVTAATIIGCSFVSNAGGAGGPGSDAPIARSGAGGRGGDGGTIHVSAGSTAVSLVNCSVVFGTTGAGGPAGPIGFPVGSPGEAGRSGGIFAGSGIAASNLLLWDNVSSAGSKFEQQFRSTAPANQPHNVAYSCVQGFSTFNGFTNIVTGNPKLLASGAIDAGSSCIDAGRSTDVPAALVVDALGMPRFVDTPLVENTGLMSASGVVVDIGAFEYQGVNARCRGDHNNTGIVNAQDIYDFLSDWYNGCP